jgi:hypothetical protein
VDWVGGVPLQIAALSYLKGDKLRATSIVKKDNWGMDFCRIACQVKSLRTAAGAVKAYACGRLGEVSLE